MLHMAVDQEQSISLDRCLCASPIAALACPVIAMFELVYLSYTLHLQTLLTCYTSHYIVAELSKCMRCSLVSLFQRSSKCFSTCLAFTSNMWIVPK